jgi:hypothetical protein
MRANSSNSYSICTTASAALLEHNSSSKQTRTACWQQDTSGNTSHAAPAVAAHCSSGVLAPQRNTSAPPRLLPAGTTLLLPLSSNKADNASSRCLQDSSLQAGTYKAAATQRQLLQDAAAAPSAAPTFSTKAFWELTAALEEDDLGCAAAAHTATAGKHQHSQHTAPASQQQVLQQQPAMQRSQPHHQQHLLSSPSQHPKRAALKDKSGFRRLQTTPGTAMFSAVLNSVPDDDTEEETEGYSDDHEEQPGAGPVSSACGFAAVLQQELQGQLGAAAAAAADTGIGSAIPSRGHALVLAGEAAPAIGYSSLVLGSSRSSRQEASPTEAMQAPTAAAAAAAAGVAIINQHGPAGNSTVTSEAAVNMTSAMAPPTAQAAASSPGSTPAPAEGDTERFLVACLQPGVVQALAVQVHADILPLCSEDGSGDI